MTAKSFVQATETNYTAMQVAEMLQMNPTTIRRMFKNEEGVLLMGRSKGHRGKRPYLTLRIPASVLERVLRRMRAT